MIVKEQIRAARALLGWSQKELASRCNGVSEPTVKLIENGRVNSSPETLGAIQNTFEMAGLEFMEGGVRFIPDVIQTFEGKDCYLRLLDDVFYTLKGADNKELLISCADDSVSPPAVNNKYREMRAAGIRMRQIVEEGNDYLMGPLEEYRYMPKDYFVNRVTLVYGPRFATVLQNETKVTVFKDPALAHVQRNLFNFIWSVTKQPKASNANERF